MYLLDYSSKTMAYKVTVEKTDIKHSKLNSELIIRRDSRFTIFVLSVELKW